MEQLTVLETAHLSVKEQHRSNRTKGRAQLLNSLGSAVITEAGMFNYAIHQKVTSGCLTEGSVMMLKDQQQ